MWRDMAEVRAANKANGQHFFDRSTQRMFQSRVVGGLYQHRYFITRDVFTTSEGEDRVSFKVWEVRGQGDVWHMSTHESLDEAKAWLKGAE